MAFPSNKMKKGTRSQKSDVKAKPSKDQETTKKSLFSSLFKKKQDTDIVVNKEDLHAGLSRALRPPKVTSQSQEDDASDQAAVHEALNIIEAAIYALDNAAEILTECLEIVTTVKGSEELGARALLAESYDELRFSIDDMADDIDPIAYKLIHKNAKNMEIEMSGRARYSITGFPLNTSSSGLNLLPPHQAFAQDSEVDETIASLQNAKKRVERTTAAYCRDAKFLMSRLNYNNASSGASKKIKKAPKAQQQPQQNVEQKVA